jgi:hypothetical protein
MVTKQYLPVLLMLRVDRVIGGERSYRKHDQNDQRLKKLLLQEMKGEDQLRNRCENC